MDDSELLEWVDVYAGTKVVAADKSSHWTDYALERASLRMNIHRGSKSAQDQALNIGHDASLAARGFANVEAVGLLAEGKVLNDQDGVSWIIVGRPSPRTRFPETAHVSCLLKQLSQRPPGVPDTPATAP